MDESVPLTKRTLDNLLGIEHTEESYRHYFQCFLEAKQQRVVVDRSDAGKKQMKWNYRQFLETPVARNIPAVQEFRNQLKLSEEASSHPQAESSFYAQPVAYAEPVSYAQPAYSQSKSPFAQARPGPNKTNSKSLFSNP